MRLKERTTATLLIAIFIISIFAVAVSVSAANPTTIESSTMHFNSIDGFTLEYDDDTKTYTGEIPMVEGSVFDVYAQEGASAWFGNDPGTGPVWTEEIIYDHDGWPTWNPDTPDWYQYSLMLWEEDGMQKWAVPNHSGTNAEVPWYMRDPIVPAQGVPMSGTIIWKGDNTGYAYETDVGEYLPPIDPLTHPEIPGGAATKGGGSACWDMDWSWGSEVVPLEYPGFDVLVTGTGDFHVSLTPAPQRGPQYFDLEYYQTQFQWRGNVGPFGSWTSMMGSSLSHSHCSLSGKALHSYFEYSPVVEELTGASTVYRQP